MFEPLQRAPDPELPKLPLEGPVDIPLVMVDVLPPEVFVSVAGLSVAAACSAPRSSSGLILGLVIEVAPSPPAFLPPPMPMPPPPPPIFLLVFMLAILFSIPAPMPPVDEVLLVPLLVVPPVPFVVDPPRKYKSVI